MDKLLREVNTESIINGICGRPYISLLSYKLFGYRYPMINIKWINGIPIIVSSNESYINNITKDNTFEEDETYDELEREDELKVIDYLKSIATTFYVYSIGNFAFSEMLVFLGTRWIIFIDAQGFSSINICTNDISFINSVLKNLPSVETVEGNPSYSYVMCGSDGFSSKTFYLKNTYNVDLNENFNDDLPINQIYDFCTKDDCGLTLFHGSPGCGKTTLIKSLIYKFNKKVRFYLIDASLLSNITSESFLSYLLEKRDCVFILEDCEKLLADRNKETNPYIGTLLNLTDGMLGEGLCIKFICTFNADINSIDKALLREGRLDICYEFKPLSLDKSKYLCNKLNKECNKPMTLAEIYKSKYLSSSIKIINGNNKMGF